MKKTIYDYYWPDSNFLKIGIEYDQISVFIFNFAQSIELEIRCYECPGISEVITWDETIIDHIECTVIEDDSSHFLEKIRGHYKYYEYKSEYQTFDLVTGYKPLDGEFIKLTIHLIDNSSFDIICRSHEVISA